MEPDTITLIEISQEHKDRYYMISLICDEDPNNIDLIAPERKMIVTNTRGKWGRGELSDGYCISEVRASRSVLQLHTKYIIVMYCLF